MVEIVQSLFHQRFSLAMAILAISEDNRSLFSELDNYYKAMNRGEDFLMLYGMERMIKRYVKFNPFSDLLEGPTPQELQEIIEKCQQAQTEEEQRMCYDLIYGAIEGSKWLRSLRWIRVGSTFDVDSSLNKRLKEIAPNGVFICHTDVSKARYFLRIDPFVQLYPKIRYVQGFKRGDLFWSEWNEQSKSWKTVDSSTFSMTIDGFRKLVEEHQGRLIDVSKEPQEQPSPSKTQTSSKDRDRPKFPNVQRLKELLTSLPIFRNVSDLAGFLEEKYRMQILKLHPDVGLFGSWRFSPKKPFHVFYLDFDTHEALDVSWKEENNHQIVLTLRLCSSS